MQNFRNEALCTLVKALCSLETEEEYFALLDDLCTVKELQDMSQRFQTAVLLSEGQNYIQVGEKTGSSSATISRVNRCLQYGSNGYANAIQKLKEKNGNAT